MSASHARAATPSGLLPPIAIPAALEQHLNTWGMRLRRELGMMAHAVPLRVGTDCAGLEAPILSLRAMQIKHTHVFTCEQDAKKREYIRQNFSEAAMFEDMCARDPATLPHHDLYVCGFPCKPFSTLHAGSSFFRQKEARPFFAVIRTLRTCLPAVAVLENVLGIKRVLARVWRALRSLQWYEVLTLEIDPHDMGEPVARPRVFFILIRVDVAVPNLDELASRLLHAGRSAATPPLSARLLPSSSPVVQHWQQQQRRKQAARPSSTLAATQGVGGLTPRMEDALRAAGVLHTGGNVDVSQSVGWSRARDVCPVVTPGSRIVVGELKRLVLPIEKCLVHLVPVHTLRWPSCLQDSDIADLGGNTMHLCAAGALVHRRWGRRGGGG